MPTRCVQNFRCGQITLICIFQTELSDSNLNRRRIQQPDQVGAPNPQHGKSVFNSWVRQRITCASCRQQMR
ncbi:hypothetical protein L596_003757 [Steinernema carpocapsae]|uniref:Uncharacterized protein n=1 Tax=Steinernema carpocapsae TaxID=34508 RepID=A0A4U8UTG0_STECR|nr:hypothetical protein L596_003757 [Steinernema carpocapsae]